jgi:hypothetical protein
MEVDGRLDALITRNRSRGTKMTKFVSQDFVDEVMAGA